MLKLLSISSLINGWVYVGLCTCTCVHCVSVKYLIFDHNFGKAIILNFRITQGSVATQWQRVESL